MENPIRVLNAMQLFLEFCATRNDSPNTIRGYNADLLLFVRCVGHESPVSEINRKKIRTFLLSLDVNLKPTSLRRKIAAVKSFCNWLVGEGYLQTNPTEGIRGPRPHDELPDVPSEADIAKLLDGRIRSASPERDRVVLELLYSCGLRAGEVAGANVEDFREEYSLLLVRGKGKKERLVPVGRKARYAIGRWLPLRLQWMTEQGIDTPSLLFSLGSHQSIERLDVRTIHRVVRRTAIAKGLPPYHPHQLRHACATHMHDHGAPIQAVAAMLGHARLSTAQIYTRVSPIRMLDVYRKSHPHSNVVDGRS
jgi:site-specific recombinase XerD